MLSWALGLFNAYRIYIIAAGAVFLLFAGWKAYDYGYDRAEAKCAAERLTATERKLNIKGKQDEIRNAPNSVAVTTGRLRNSTF